MKSHAKVTFQKVKDFLWIKGIFWVPWKNLETEAAVRTTIEKIEVGTGLVLAGVAAPTGTSLQPARAEVNVLSSIIPNFALAILPSRVHEAIHVLQADATSTNGSVLHEV